MLSVCQTTLEKLLRLMSPVRFVSFKCSGCCSIPIWRRSTQSRHIDSMRRSSAMQPGFPQISNFALRLMSSRL